MYSTTDELEAALASLAAAYPTTSTLLAVPQPTHDGRTAHVLRVGARTDGPDGIAILGGVHAREWIPPEMCVSLAADLLEAYATGTGLGYGGVAFTAAEVHRVMQTVDLYVFACVNPDGRVHSQTTESLWRKNRRANGGGCFGVDINRNFDFLWDHSAKFAADSGVNTSSDPCHATVYRGPSAASEPETQNVVWLLDTFPVRWLVDVHSAVPVVLYSWGSDTDQTADTAQSFLNASLDTVRGRLGDGVGEYLTTHDLSVGSTLATTMSDQALAVRGTVWPVEQAMTLYPTSGAERRLLVLPALRRPGPTRRARVDDRVRVLVPARVVGGRAGRAGDLRGAPAVRAGRLRGHRRPVGRRSSTRRSTSRWSSSRRRRRQRSST